MCCFGADKLNESNSRDHELDSFQQMKKRKLWFCHLFGGSAMFSVAGRCTTHDTTTVVVMSCVCLFVFVEFFYFSVFCGSTPDTTTVSLWDVCVLLVPKNQ